MSGILNGGTVDTGLLVRNHGNSKQAGVGVELTKLYGEVIDKFSNPATRRNGLTVSSLLIDISIANSKIVAGTGLAAMGIGTALGTLFEDVVSGGAGVSFPKNET